MKSPAPLSGSFILQIKDPKASSLRNFGETYEAAAIGIITNDIIPNTVIFKFNLKLIRCPKKEG